MARNLAFVRITDRLLHDLVHLPKGSEIVDGVWDRNTNTLCLKVRDDRIPAVPEDCEILHMLPRYQPPVVWPWEEPA